MPIFVTLIMFVMIPYVGFAAGMCIDQEELLRRMESDTHSLGVLEEKPTEVLYLVGEGDCHVFKMSVKYLGRLMERYPYTDRSSMILVEDLAKYLAWDQTRFEFCPKQLDGETVKTFIHLYSGSPFRKYAPDFEEVVKSLNKTHPK